MHYTSAVITARKRSLGQGNIFAPVCHSVHRGVSGQVHPPGQVHPRQVHPLGKYTPRAGTPPGQVPTRQVHLSHQCMLGYGQQAGGTHPTVMHSCSLSFLSAKLHNLGREKTMHTQQGRNKVT